MDVTNQFEPLLTSSFKSVFNTLAGFYLNFLSNLVKFLRYFLRFEMLRTLQKKLYRMYRERMALVSHLPPVTHPEIIKSKVVVTVPADNVDLLGNLFLPVEAVEGNLKVPAVLIRTPYDKDSPLMGPALARLFAERGYACLIQDTRGRFGSGGDFFPIAHEVKDGSATVAWVRRQSWSNGKVGTYGISYLGLTSYASAGGGQKVDACCPVMACSRLYPIIYHGGNAFAFDLVIRWLWLVIGVMQEKNPLKQLMKMLNPRRDLDIALHPVGSSPVHHRDLDIVGKELDFYRKVMESHELGHDFWTEKDILCDLSKPDTPPLSVVAGWHDMFVAQSFKDLEMAQKVKTDAPLTFICGPWSHWQFLSYGPIGFKAAFELFDVQLKGEKPKVEDEDIIDVEAGPTPRPTRVIVQLLHSETPSQPKGRWLRFNAWPPIKKTQLKKYYLISGGKLGNEMDVSAQTYTEHVYDPQNPTPSYGGPSFDWTNSGRIAQNELEGRDDVLVFTSPKLTESLVVAGEVTLKLFLWSNNPHTDVFVKLCDVDGNSGRSMNVMEKMTRLSTSHKWDSLGNLELDIDVGPIAVEFKKGNYVRLVITGAAHPLYLRHNGTPDHVSTDMKPALRKIFHSMQHRTSISLPVLKL